MLDQLSDRYHVDPARIVVHGYQGGGSLAYRVAFGHRQLIRGVAAVDAALPTSPPDNDPALPLAVYTTASQQSELAERIDAGIQRLRQLQYPVTAIDQGPTPRYLNAAELAELARWIDTLDRI